MTDEVSAIKQRCAICDHQNSYNNTCRLTNEPGKLDCSKYQGFQHRAFENAKRFREDELRIRRKDRHT